MYIAMCIVMQRQTGDVHWPRAHSQGDVDPQTILSASPNTESQSSLAFRVQHHLVLASTAKQSIAQMILHLKV